MSELMARDTVPLKVPPLEENFPCRLRLLTKIKINWRGRVIDLSLAAKENIGTDGGHICQYSKHGGIASAEPQAGAILICFSPAL